MGYSGPLSVGPNNKGLVMYIVFLNILSLFISNTLGKYD